MKKVFLSMLLMGFAFASMAQNANSEEQMMRQWRQLKHQRDISKQASQSNIPLSETTATPKSAKALPEDRVWFPGEWEELQAVVVTPYYSYSPDTNLGSGYYTADPIVTGVAEYYKYNASRGWVSTGIYGRYKAIMDTNSDFGKTFFSLMNGIQLGHAEAWVRVESEADTAKVLRTLTRLNYRTDSIRFIIGPGNSFWYRDCGPICFYHGDQDSVAMMDFEYYPGRALDDSLPSLITRQMGLPNYINSIEWEGGNCLVDGAGLLFTSDAVYSNNNDRYGQITWNGRDVNSITYTSKTPLSNAQTKAALASLLGQRETHILPTYRYDGGTGHIDLYADMCEENGFVFSVMPTAYSSWADYITGAKNIDSLCSYTSIFDRNYYKSEIPFPSKDNGSNFSSQSEYNSNYTRTYSNHTFVNDLILQPVFSAVVNGEASAEWDRQNIEEMKAAYPGYTIYPLDVREFDGSGGAIHCITKQIPADNPVRILHKSIVGSANAMRGNDIPVSAIVTNRSGIASAECVYRINGGEWNTIALTANGNKFSSVIPTSSINDRVLDTMIVDADMADTTIYPRDTLVTVEYYLRVTSNNGKTITKPMTAHQGGYYSFYYNGQEEELDSTNYDFSTEPRPMTDITFVFDANRTTLDTSSAPEIPTLGIADVEAGQSFGHFYPNPSNEQAHISIDLGNGGSYSVAIVDNLGRTIHTSTLQAAGSIIYTIRTDKLASGIYNVVFSGNGQRVVRRLIVK